MSSNLVCDVPCHENGDDDDVDVAVGDDDDDLSETNVILSKTI